ncbi:MAG: Uma2 family endonuclease [Deinococcota bacterium]
MSISPEDLIMQADVMNVRLDMMRGLAVWEAAPVAQHQLELDRIRASIQVVSSSGDICVHLANVLFKFQENSWVTPDIALLQTLPPSSERHQALNSVPEAVVEIISEGYKRKDLELAPEFYLAMGVQDVVIFDPQTRLVYHHRKDGTKRLESPIPITFECGCSCEV